MCRQNHGVSVDYFAAGVMAFECMFGRVNQLFLFYFRDLMLARPDKKSEIIFYPNKFRSKEMKYPEAGL